MLSEHLNPTAGELANRARGPTVGAFCRETNIFITSAAAVTPEQSQTLLHGWMEIYRFAREGGVNGLNHHHKQRKEL